MYLHQVQSLTRWLRRRILLNHQVHVRVGAHNLVRVSKMTSEASALTALNTILCTANNLSSTFVCTVFGFLYVYICLTLA